MDTNISKMSMKKKDKDKLTLPKGAKEVSRKVDVSVEEIENGYLICKEICIEYSMPDRSYTDCKYCTKKYYSEECPTIEVDSKNKELADLFESE